MGNYEAATDYFEDDDRHDGEHRKWAEEKAANAIVVAAAAGWRVTGMCSPRPGSVLISYERGTR